MSQGLTWRVIQSGRPMTLFSWPPSIKGRVLYVLYVDGSLHLQEGRELRHRVAALLRRGERRIVLDLTRVSQIDAAGVGALVRIYNIARAVKATVYVVNPTAWVRAIIERVGLDEVLLADRLPFVATDRH